MTPAGAPTLFVIDDDAAVRAEHWDALELHFLLGLGMFVEDQIHVSAMSLF
jgi:hypothetical protein